MLKVLPFRTNHDMMDLMAESVAHHQATLDINSPRDFTDAMLIEIQKTTDKDSSFYGDFGIENLKNVLFDLFLAGSETTSTTLTWAALYMVRYPHVQARVQAELDTVVGKNRRPACADKPNLPYTEVGQYKKYTNIFYFFGTKKKFMAFSWPGQSQTLVCILFFLGCTHGGSEIRQYCAQWCSAPLPP